MPKLYNTDIKLEATLYIMAESKEEAERIAAEVQGGIEFSSRRQSIGYGLEMTGEPFSPDMPPVSLSPVMTIIDGPSKRIAYLLEEFDEEAEEEDSE